MYDSGIRSIAVCLLHGYTFPTHEALIGRIAREIGFEHISLSHELMPMIKLVPRATSVCADAYLTPAIKKYINGFQSGFEGALGVKSDSAGKGARCEFMQSDGGLVDVGRVHRTQGYLVRSRWRCSRIRHYFLRRGDKDPRDWV